MDREVAVKRHERRFPKSKAGLRAPGERVLVKPHRRVIKITASKRFIRVRLKDPSKLKGYRFRLVAASKATPLTKEERDALKKVGGKVVLAVRGPRGKPSGVKAQAILIPRKED